MRAALLLSLVSLSLLSLSSACVSVPRATVPSPGAACAPLQVEASQVLLSASRRPHARLVVLPGGTPHVVWSTPRSRHDRSAASLSHASEHAGQWQVERDLLAGEPAHDPFQLALDHDRPVIAVSQGRRGEALLVGPPWRRVLELPPNSHLATDPAGRLQVVTITEGPRAELSRLEGDRLVPVQQAPLRPLYSSADLPRVQATREGVALLYLAQPPPRPPPEPPPPGLERVQRPERPEGSAEIDPSLRAQPAGVLFSGLDQPAPAALPLGTPEAEILTSRIEHTEYNGLQLRSLPVDGRRPEPIELPQASTSMQAACLDPRDPGRTLLSQPDRSKGCKVGPMTLRFHDTKLVRERPGATVVLGTEWIERSPAVWRSPICSNDRAPIGWVRTWPKRGEGQLVLAQIPDGQPLCLHGLPLKLGAKPVDQGPVDAAFDAQGRLHLLAWAEGRLIYLRLR